MLHIFLFYVEPIICFIDILQNFQRRDTLTQLRTPRGLGVFEMALVSNDSNTTGHHPFFRAVSQALQVCIGCITFV